MSSRPWQPQNHQNIMHFFAVARCPHELRVSNHLRKNDRGGFVQSAGTWKANDQPGEAFGIPVLETSSAFLTAAGEPRPIFLLLSCPSSAIA
jgi:hypothetical protein